MKLLKRIPPISWTKFSQKTFQKELVKYSSNEINRKAAEKQRKYFLV